MPSSTHRIIQSCGLFLAFGTALLAMVHSGCAEGVGESLPRSDEPTCATPPCSDDANEDGGSDDSGPIEGEDITVCGQLLAQSCGPFGECERDPGCVAATLIARFEAQRCTEAANDPRSFPLCSLGACQRLTNRVCGGAPAPLCESAPACAPARELQRRAEAGDADAAASCAQALTDEVVFPACQE
jgi:hypothetical protein